MTTTAPDPRDAARPVVPLRGDLSPRPGTRLLPQLDLRRAGRTRAEARRRGCGSRSAARACWSSAARTSRSAASTTSAATAARGICDDEQGFARTHLRCPYHAWGYALDGTLVTTPMIEKEEIDRDVDLPVAGAHRHLGGLRLRQPLPRGAASRCSSTWPTSRTSRSSWPGSASPTCASGTSPPIDVAGQLEDRARELQRVPALPDDPPRAGRGRAGVQEGLHLRERPRRRRCLAGRRTHGDGHRPAARGCRCCPASRGPGARTRRPTTARGIYPTMFLDVDGSTCLATAVFPTGPQSCRLVTEYLFSPEALEDPDFDPSPVVEFNELVTARTTRPASACSAGSRRAPSTTACSRPRTPGCTASTSATGATSRAEPSTTRASSATTPARDWRAAG